MIFGVGVDIVKVSRMERWVGNGAILERFFNIEETAVGGSTRHLCEHYAARFAAKEAFSKALGTGLQGFALKDVYIASNNRGSPRLVTVDTAKEALEEQCGKNARVYVSLSHEKEYAVAFVVIEK